MQITKTLLPDAISRHGGGMEWLKNVMIEPGPYTGTQVLVFLMMLILLAFAIWAIRQSDTYRSLSFSDTPLINAVGWAALILALPGALLFVGTLATLFHLAVLFPDASSDESMQRRHATLLLSLLAAIGALVGLVFGLIRLFAVERQTKAQEEKNRLEGEALFNDKMTAATTDLYSRRQTRDSKWQDDVPRRNSAIDRLEGLVHERPDQAPRVARLLSVYLRELSGADEVPAVPYDEPTSIDDLKDWVKTLKPRSDMENAVQTLGRLRAIAGVDADAVTIDLRAANLQAIDFEGGNFNGARLNGAQLQGADLSQAQMEGANLRDARLEVASLYNTYLQEAHLSYANLLACNLKYARLQDANLMLSTLNEVFLENAQLTGASLPIASMHNAALADAGLQGVDLQNAILVQAIFFRTEFDAETNLKDADLTGAMFRRVDLSPLNISAEQLNTAFGDGSVTLPDHIDWPAHWPRESVDYDEFEKQWRAFQASLPPGWDEPKD